MSLQADAESVRSSLTSPFSLAGLIAVLLFAYTIYGVVYRLYLSPVAHIPGPLFARLTFWNEFYYDVVLGGKYTFVIKSYHDKYGPVVRINPYEVHILDPDFYEQLYVGGSKGKVDKWSWSTRMFGPYDVSAFDTCEHDRHRMRREPWNPYFSKASVARLQPLLIQKDVKKLCDRLAEFQAAGKPVIMTYAYACLTADVISEYSFPEGYNYLDWQPDFQFKGEHYEAWASVSKTSHMFKQFGWLYPVLKMLPLWYVKLTSIETYRIIREHQALFARAKLIAAQLDSNNKSDYKETTGRPSMLEAFMTSPALPLHERKPERIGGEAIIAMGAGTITSTHALKTATYHILANPPILSRLLTELEAAIPDLQNNPPDLRKLESIDYLMAVLYETLRIFYGVSHRLQRIHPDRPIVYRKGTEKEIVIPPGTPVSMTSVHVHDDERIFPNARTFNPDRWLPLQTNGVRLQKYLMTFGRGTRQCVGMELGKAEILTAIANVFMRFGRSMRLVDCARERDVDLVRDAFNPLPSKDNNGLLVSFNPE